MYAPPDQQNLITASCSEPLSPLCACGGSFNSSFYFRTKTLKVASRRVLVLDLIDVFTAVFSNASRSNTIYMA